MQATVGENLGTRSKKVITDTVQTLAGGSFAPLSVLLVEPCPKPQPRVPGLPDEAFIRGKTPMTKQEVRAAALAAGRCPPLIPCGMSVPERAA